MNKPSRFTRLVSAWKGEDIQQIGLGFRGPFNNSLDAFSSGYSTAFSSGYRSAFGFTVPSQEEARTIATYYACVSLVARMMSQMPLRFVRNDGTVTLVRMARIWNKNPRQLMSGPRLTNWVSRQILEYGNCYLEIESDGFNTPARLAPIHAGRVITRHKADADDSPFLTEHVVRTKSGNRVIDDADMLHFMGEETDGLYGCPMLTSALKNVVSLALEEEIFAGETFIKDPQGRVHIQLPGMGNDEQIQAVSSRWEKTNVGRKSRSKPIVTGEDVSITPLDLAANEGMILGSRLHSGEDICRVFGIAPSLVGYESKTATYAVGYRELNRAFHKNRLAAFAHEMENEIETKLVTARSGVRAQFNPDVLLALSREEQVALLNTETAGLQLKSVNEARTELGLEEVEGQDGINTDPNREEFLFRRQTQGN